MVVIFTFILVLIAFGMGMVAVLEVEKVELVIRKENNTTVKNLNIYNNIYKVNKYFYKPRAALSVLKAGCQQRSKFHVLIFFFWYIR